MSKLAEEMERGADINPLLDVDAERRS